MSLTPAQIKAAFFNVLKTDSAGSSVRAALGGGAASVIQKKDLKTSPLPATPFLVLWWNSQPSGGPRNRGTQTYYPVWAIYDDVVKDYFRIEALVPLIQAAYPETAIAMCYVDFEPERDLIDAKLNNMPAKSMLFKIKTRG